MMKLSSFVMLLLVVLSAHAGEMVTTPVVPPGSRIIDLSHAFDATTIYWPTASGFELLTDFKGTTNGGFYYEANTFRSAEHGGTHLDAPAHFAEGQLHVDQVPLESLIGPAVLINVTEQVSADRDYQVSADDFLTWETAHGTLPDGIIILLRTGFGAFWPDRKAYLGTEVQGADAVPLLHFPGLHPDAAQWLVEHRAIHAIGLDTASIDYGQSTGFESHRALMAKGIPVFENVAGMDQLPTSGFQVIALPMKITGGSGGPLRIVAIIP
ncbi:MAG: cyclase family protein [Xanthomonadales bacterium]|nr:cyclase family protein [Xanthomonadales bacterium]